MAEISDKTWLILKINGKILQNYFRMPRVESIWYHVKNLLVTQTI